MAEDLVGGLGAFEEAFLGVDVEEGGGGVVALDFGAELVEVWGLVWEKSHFGRPMAADVINLCAAKGTFTIVNDSGGAWSRWEGVHIRV